MEQANYNGGGFGGRGRLFGVFERGVDSLAPPRVCDLPPHVASLCAAQYGVTHGCDPSGVPCLHCEQMAMPLACPAMPLRASLPMGTNAASLRCRFACL